MITNAYYHVDQLWITGITAIDRSQKVCGSDLVQALSLLVVRMRTMWDQHTPNIEQQRAYEDQIRTAEQRLSAAAYVNEVTRHLSRLRQTSAADAARRI